MTWITCSRCQQSPCACRVFGPPNVAPYQPQPYTFVPYPQPTRLSEEDVQRIAKALAGSLRLAPIVVTALPIDHQAENTAAKEMRERRAKKPAPRKLKRSKP